MSGQNHHLNTGLILAHHVLQKFIHILNQSVYLIFSHCVVEGNTDASNGSVARIQRVNATQVEKFLPVALNAFHPSLFRA